MTTREKILLLLREHPKTISELTEKLNLARNAIAVQMDRLSAEGIVLKGEIRQNVTAGKPAREYMIAPGTEDSGSSAYMPFVASLLKNLPNHLDKKQRKQLLENVGRDMAIGAGISHQPDHSNMGDLHQRIEIAIATVNQLGATAELIEEDKQLTIRNVSCPLATAVRREPCVCDAVAAFFTEATGAKTKADCLYGENLTCRYVISKNTK